MPLLKVILVKKSIACTILRSSRQKDQATVQLKVLQTGLLEYMDRIHHLFEVEPHIGMEKVGYKSTQP